MNRRSFITALAGLPIVGKLFGLEKHPKAGDVVDWRVCLECEADRLAKRSRGHGVPSLVYDGSTQITFNSGDVEIFRVCAHRMWVNPAVKTNEAAREFITHCCSYILND